MDQRNRHVEGTCPGALLKDLVLPALNITISQAARDLKITRQTLHRILAGHAAITPDMAIRLEKFCGVSCQVWLERQQKLDLERVARQIGELVARIPSHVLPAALLASIGGSRV